jgi:hypothetical protein
LVANQVDLNVIDKIRQGVTPAFSASSPRNQHLDKIKDLPQTSKTSGVPEAFKLDIVSY